MKTLYFYSQKDEEIRIASIKTSSQVTSIINELQDEYFLRFLLFKTSIVKPKHLIESQNKISLSSIRVVLDAIGCFDTHFYDGVSLNKFLLHDPDKIKLIVAMAKEDKSIARYLHWVIGNYVKLFNYHYGELIMVVSNRDDIKSLPAGFLPVKFSTDKRVFYTKHDHTKTMRICKACKIQIKKGKILSLYPSAFLIAFSQLILQGADFITDLAKF